MASNEQMELMRKARESASFSSATLTNIIFGGKEAVELRDKTFARLENLLGQEDQMKLPIAYGAGDRDEAFIDGLTWGKAIVEDEIQHRHGLFDMTSNRFALGNASPFGLHTLMFIPTLDLQSSPEQKSHWLPLANKWKILGAYAQTELGHGTFLRGVETTATYDEENDQFIILSPTVTSAKYWPGSLGFATSHAIVMARLILKNKDYGMHPFMVQLRSLDDWKPLPGIELGDIGLKMGMNGTDNGYAIFKHVRIPRTHMLMGMAQVQKDGTYLRTGNDKTTYSTMIWVRKFIVRVVTFQLAQAVTIAIRYSTIRTQGHGHYSEAPAEVAIMSFKSQHSRLLALTAQSYALLFASKACDAIYEDLISQQAKADHSLLPYCHALTSGLKAYAAQIAADGAEDARKCCGGHGYSQLSGLPEIVALTFPHMTWEGEHYVMYQQTARYLMKVVTATKENRVVDKPMQYLSEAYICKAKGLEVLEPRVQMLHSSNGPQNDHDTRCRAQGLQFLDAEIQLSVFRHRAVRLIFEAERLLRTAEKDAKSKDVAQGEAWNECMMPLISAARAHIDYFVLQVNVQTVARIEDPAVRKVMSNCCSLFALNAMENGSAPGAIGFFEDGYISLDQLRTIRRLVNDLHKTLLPEAIALTDAWNFTNSSLQSALGVKDGNVYETMMAWTRQLPINVKAREDGNVHRVGWEGYIKPLLKGEAKAKL